MIHRLLLAACGVVAYASALHAQDQTLVRGNTSFGGFGGPTVAVGSILGETGVFVGGRGAFLIGRRFAIGGAGVGLSSEVPVARALSSRRYDLEFGYGGVTLEAITQPSKLVHVTGLVLIGGGAANARVRDRDRIGFQPPIGFPDDDPDVVTVIEPELAIELNVTNWMRIALGGSYRFVSGTDADYLFTNSGLSGGTGKLTFKFGAF
ncbi:MAG: hypothetical protein MUF00_11910 [Gemmatimonadaceae bacterium]|jgi:hypothetical protein|nr:hypothetical protein [Gemmatimonadaceae bacterium]